MDCLVLKLKESINDEYLLKPDELLWKVVPSNKTSLLDVNYVTEPLILTLIGSTGVFEANGTTTIVEPVGSYRLVNIKVTTGDGYIKISNKNYIVGIGSTSNILVNIEDLVYARTLSRITSNHSYGDISTLENKIGLSLEEISLLGNSNNTCYGDATNTFNIHHCKSFLLLGSNDISLKVNLLNFSTVSSKLKFSLIGITTDNFDISLLNGYNYLVLNNITGNVTGSLSSLTNPNITYLDLDEINITGSINDWLDLLYAAGRTSGSLNIRVRKCYLTWMGIEPPASLLIEFSATGWTKTN